MNNKIQVVDLAISHHQIHFYSTKDVREELYQWGDINVEQGAIIHKDYVIFDPILDDAFGANIKICISKLFELDSQSQRCIAVPFYITNKDSVMVASAFQEFKVDLDFTDTLYTLYYEACEGTEVFYKLTLVPSEQPVEPKYLLDDPWGGEKNKPLVIGFA